MQMDIDNTVKLYFEIPEKGDTTDSLGVSGKASCRRRSLPYEQEFTMQGLQRAWQLSGSPQQFNSLRQQRNTEYGLCLGLEGGRVKSPGFLGIISGRLKCRSLMGCAAGGCGGRGSSQE